MWGQRRGLLLLLPAVLWVLIFTLFPLLYSLHASFHRVTTETQVERLQVPQLDAVGKPVLRPDGSLRMRTQVNRETVTHWEFVGLTNYQRLANDPQVREALMVTGGFVLVAVSLELTLGLLLALLFFRESTGHSLLRGLMILPIFATPVAVGYLFFTIFYEEGGPLGWTGIPWLSDPHWALVSIIIVDVWQWTPFCFLVFLAALQGIPVELLEAARLETHSTVMLWRDMLLPLLWPVIVIVLLLRLAEAVKVFDVVASLTMGGPGNATQSLSYLAFRTGLRFFDVGYASAMAYTLLAAVMLVVLLCYRRLSQVYG